LRAQSYCEIVQERTDIVLSASRGQFALDWDGMSVWDQRAIAEISLLGMAFNFVGGLYLANDLFGERQGPLRFLLRMALYGGIFGATYWVAFGAVLGICAGAGLGSALAIELRRSPSRSPISKFLRRISLAGFRAATLGLGFGITFTAKFGYMFFVLGTIALFTAYAIGFSPADVRSERRGLTRAKAMGSLVRAGLLGLAVAVAAVLAMSDRVATTFALRVGAVVGVVGILVGLARPVIEAATDNMPRKRLGYIGAVLIGVGMTLQTWQYWVAVFQVH
jgi:hypothetical protein